MNEAPAFRVRAATVCDADAIAALIVAAFSSYPKPLDPPSSALKDTPETVRTKLASHGAVIAESGGRAVGCLLFSPEDGNVLYLGRLAVDTDWRRRGVARALVGHAEAEARRRGLHRLRIRVRIPLVSNQQLFKSCGFVEVSRETHPGYVEPTSIRMEKTL